MITLRLRSAALEDVTDIFEHGELNHGMSAALAYLHGLDDALMQLQNFPQMGMARPELAPALRSLSYHRHHIYYLFLDDHISVVRILHKSMDARLQIAVD